MKCEKSWLNKFSGAELCGVKERDLCVGKVRASFREESADSHDRKIASCMWREKGSKGAFLMASYGGKKIDLREVGKLLL